MQLTTTNKGEIEMATTQAPRIGPVFRTLQSEAVQAYQANDKEMVESIMVRYNATKELVSALRHTLDTLYDNANSGFGDTEWLNGIERITKVDPDKPRGRKAAIKVDPADLA